MRNALTRRLRRRWHHVRRVIAALGVRQASAHFFRHWRRRDSPSVRWLHPRAVTHPVGVRSLSSDMDVFDQVFLQHEYAPLYPMTDARLVIDCGANVGYSAACFLSRFPNCHVMAIEPDPDNFAMLERNLRAYGDRTTLVRAGVWSHRVPLVMSPASYRDGREWTRQVQEFKEGNPADLEGIDIGSLLARSGYDRVSLLKVDVEGAEAVIFRENVEWLAHVDAIAIELHDDTTFGDSSAVFFAAIREHNFAVSQSGELTVCRRLT